MKLLRPFLAASILTLAFSLTTFAGQMETGVTSQSQTPSTATVGDMETGVTATDNTADPLTEIALGFMQSVLNLF
jgi:hypothetical protein